MKYSVAFISLFLFFSNAKSSEKIMKTNIFSSGYGMGAFSANMLYNQSLPSSYRFNPIGPIYFKYCHSLTSNTSVGLCLAWIKDRYFFEYVDTASVLIRNSEIHESYSVMLRFNQNIFAVEEFQIYAGAGLGYKSNYRSFRNESKKVYIAESVTPGFPFAFECTIGSRYFISDHLGIYIEVGVAKSVMQGGLAYGF